MEHTTFTVPVRAGTDPDAKGVISLYQALQVLPDPRRGQGKRYSLALILSLVIVAKLAGEQTMSGVTEWVRHRGPELVQHFPVMPTDDAVPDDRQQCISQGRWEATGCDCTGLFGPLLSTEPLWRRTQPFAHPRGPGRSHPAGAGWQKYSGDQFTAASRPSTGVL